MRIEVNGESQNVDATNLSELLHQLDYVDTIVATARNGTFVRAHDRSKTLLEPDDRIEILVPRQGG